MSAPIPVRTAVGKTIALSLIRGELSGFRGYPFNEAGEDRFARELATVSLSVGHARAIVESFEETFPTIKELRDVASNLRPKFEQAENLREIWEMQYGKPDPLVLTGEVDTSNVREMWKKLRLKFTQPGEKWGGWALVSWRQIYMAMEELGYPLNSDQRAIRGPK